MEANPAPKPINVRGVKVIIRSPSCGEAGRSPRNAAEPWRGTLIRIAGRGRRVMLQIGHHKTVEIVEAKLQPLRANA